jgi:hypothetical protein
VRPPLAGRRAAARKLAGDLRRRLGVADAEPPEPQAAPPPPVDGEQAAHRIDAARARLRSTIVAPDENAERDE